MWFRSTTADASKGIVVNVDLQTGQPAIPMKLNGNVDVNAILDSGNGGDVDFATDLISRHGLRFLIDPSIEGYFQSHKAFYGVGGVEEDECGKLDSLSVGPIVYSEAPACKSRSFNGNNILVGFDFIKNFNLIFDYPEGHLVLIPRHQ